MLKNKLLSAMGGVEPSDPDFENVTLLLHGDGTNGGQNNTFLDASTNNFTITRNGNTTQGSFSPYGPNWSNYFDGTGDYLTSSGSTNSAVGSGDFSVESFVYYTAYPTQYTTIFSTKPSTANTTTGFGLGVENNGSVYSYSSVFIVQSAAAVFSLNSWNHVVFTRSGSTARLFVNGVLRATGANSQNFSNQAFAIGAHGNGAEIIAGYVSNLRLVKGSIPTAYQTASTTVGAVIFTPPTEPVTAITDTQLLTCQSNRFIDNSTNNFAITRNGDVSVQRFSPFAPPAEYSTATIGGSGFFDGTGDYLTLADNAAFNLGSSNFTAECWAYFNSTVDQYFFAQISIGAGDRSFILAINASKLYFEVRSGTTAYSITAANNVVINQWMHLAAVRNGSTITLYQNGVSIGTVNVSGVTLNNSPYLMGVGCGGSYVAEPMVGYMTDARLVVGTAVYTSAFTPPTAPLTAITNTQLLTNFTNAAIFDNAMMNDLETVGNAQISTSVVKYGTGSMAFDGTNSALIGPTSQNTVFNGNFTVEFWVYKNVDKSFNVYFDTRVGSTGSATGFTIASNSSGQFVFFTNNTFAITSASSYATATWFHIAVVRSGSTITLYVDGTSVGTTTNSTAFTDGGLVVGFSRPDAVNYANAYIDDLRITKGVARYTATFTPPTAALPNK
jgi:hypothetical protein